MTLGTFICLRVTYLCPFLTMCTGPYGVFFLQNIHLSKDIDRAFLLSFAARGGNF